MVMTLLSSGVRDTWLGTIQGQPDMANWDTMNAQFTTWYGTKDKRAEAEAKFARTELKKDTEAAWQAYHTAQTKAIADMVGPRCNLSEEGIWNGFLGNLGPVPKPKQYTAKQIHIMQLTGKNMSCRLLKPKLPNSSHIFQIGLPQLLQARRANRLLLLQG